MLAVRSGASTTVAVDVEGGDAEGADTTLVLVEASATTGARVARRFQAPGVAELNLDGSLDWELQASAPGFWSRPQRLVPGESRVRLTLYAAAVLASSFEVPHGEESPAEVRLRLQDPRALGELVIVGGEVPAPEAPTLEEAGVVCPVVGSLWSCTVPAGKWDLRVRVESYISHNYWELELPPGQTVDLKRMRLEKGASVVGRVAVDDGVLPSRVSVELGPSQADRPTTRQGLLDLERLSLSTSVNGRGYFVFSGMPPGSYRIEASAKGLVAAVMAPVPVYENAETEVTRPLVLTRPLEVDFAISPPMDPEDRQWAAHLAKRLEMPGRLEEVGEHVVSEDGTFSARGLAPGEYLVTLVDGAGRRFAAQDVTLFEGQDYKHLDLQLVRVEGTVALGADPLVADAYFGGRKGVESIRMRSDEEGAFSGYLPREGLWLADVVAGDGSVNRRFRDVRVRATGDGIATVELTLPSTRLAGSIVDERGSPVSGALVLVFELVSQVALHKTADAEGEFVFMGLGEGPVLLEAEAYVEGARLKSERRIVSLVEGVDPGRQELVARPTIRVRGRVVSPTGQGVPAAAIVGEVTGTSILAGTVATAVTGVDGGFALELPSDAVYVDTWALPLGCSLSYARIHVESTESTEIECNDDAGTLQLELPPQDLPGENETRPSTLIFINGVVLRTNALHRWAALNGEARKPEGDLLVVPQMPAGNYSYCFMTSSEALQFTRSGEVPSQACSTGFLRRNGSLSLTR